VTREGNGGAVYCTGDSVCTITDSSILENKSPGGLGGGIYANGNTKLTSKNNEWRKNSATYGGAQYVDDNGEAEFISDSYIKNSGVNNGGVAEVSGNAVVTWKSSYFLDNDAAGTPVLILRGGKKFLIDSCTIIGTDVYNNNEALIGATSGEITIRNTSISKGR
jgi:hypothetical protein